MYVPQPRKEVQNPGIAPTSPLRNLSANFEIISKTQSLG
uniref:Uncharacterized protein n=1 Tax=Rhizophora mucronata TaxID=61149 RepID=A0A2P2NJE1_RHIMU